MALYLNLLKNIYPPWVDIFDMAEQVIIRLANWNSKFSKHMLKTAQKNVITQSKVRSENIWKIFMFSESRNFWDKF